MAKRDDLNPMEEMVIDGAKVYVELVEELLDEAAPFRPWWSVRLSDDELLFRWQEVRGEIIPWLVEAGIFMGFKTFEEMLENLEKYWTGELLVDMVPPEIIDELPIALVELVQAGPKDAADHIRKGERLFVKTRGAAAIIGPPLPPIPMEMPPSVDETVPVGLG